MTHDGKGCCGTKDPVTGECDRSACYRNWITGLAVVVAIAAVAYAATKDGMVKASHPPKAEVAKLINGEDTVVAKINGDKVYKSDVALAVRELGANVPPDSMDQILPAFLEQYINLKLLADAAHDEGVASDPEVKSQMANANEQIVRAAYLRKLFEGQFTDEALRTAYTAKYEDQPMPQEVHGRHILVDSEDKAKDLIAKLNAGASFEKLARENSKDPSAARGGDLGYFTQAEMVKEFGDAAFAMKPGQISQTPVKTQFGWHVIKVEDKRQRTKPSFEEAKQSLEQEARQAILDKKLTELRAKAKIEIEPAAQPAPAAGDAPAAPMSTPASAPAQ